MIKDSYFHKATNVKTWTLLNTAQKMVIPLGAMGILAGLLVLCGYVLDVESLYRPIEGGAATNPITAILFILLGYSLVSPKKYQLGRLISALLIMLITVVRILSFVFQNELYAYFMPFQNIVFFEQSQGKSNNLGINSAVMFFLLSCSIVAYYFKAFRLSQFIAFFSINIPLISIIGYAYDVDNIYGQMSLYTTSFGLILSVSTLLLTANKLLMNGLMKWLNAMIVS